MEAEPSGGKAEGGGQTQWTPTQSAFMLTYLADIVANGTRTSSGFKKVHLNQCAKALNEHFKLTRTGEQIGNHLKTWKRKYSKINQLRKLSAALWDEDTFTISLDHEHYTDYVKDHKGDDEFLNKPLKHYGEMATIFGNSVATGKFAKGSNDSLATGGDFTEENEGEAAAEENDSLATGATSSATRPHKRSKIVDGEGEGLIAAFDRAAQCLSKAIKEAGAADKAVPEGLFEDVNSLPGFEMTHKSLYYRYLVDNPHVARAFSGLPLEHKLLWVAKFVGEKFPGC